MTCNTLKMHTFSFKPKHYFQIVKIFFKTNALMLLIVEAKCKNVYEHEPQTIPVSSVSGSMSMNPELFMYPLYLVL